MNANNECHEYELIACIFKFFKAVDYICNLTQLDKHSVATSTKFSSILLSLSKVSSFRL